MWKSICILTAFSSILSVHSADARSACLKAYGGSPAEALRAGTELLERTNLKTEKGDMQIRILPEKERGLFVAAVSSVHDQELCGFLSIQKKNEPVRPKCKETICLL